MGVNMALFRKKTVKLHIDGEKIFIEGDNHWFHLKTEKTRILPIRPYTSDWFVSLSSIHIPARYCIIFRQSRNKQFHLPCNDLSDQRQIMREIEQFLKRY